MIGVVINPHAGRNRGDHERCNRMKEIVGGAGIVVEPASLRELDTVLDQFEARGVTVLAVCGGDGSFFRTLSSAVRSYGPERMPTFLPLRAGSMNTIARSVGCRRGKPEAVLRQVVGDLARGVVPETVQTQLLCINGGHFGFMTGAGAVVNFLQAYYDEPGRGPLTAVSVFVRAVVSGMFGGEFARSLLGGVEAVLTCDGTHVEQRHFNFLYASSVTEIGLGLKVTARGMERRGFFHLVACDVRPLEVVARILRLWRGRPLELPRSFDDIVAGVHIEFPQATHYMIDGDVLEAVTSLMLTSGPRLTILR